MAVVASGLGVAPALAPPAATPVAVVAVVVLVLVVRRGVGVGGRVLL